MTSYLVDSLTSLQHLLRANALARFILAAILVRTCTGGAAVAVILLAKNSGADGSLIGVLTACLTVPHVVGPIYGRWLEKAKNPFFIIAVACLFFAIFFQMTIWNIGTWSTWLVVISLLVCGACSSFLMGGLSTQLNRLVSDDLTAKRRAQSWDAMTYGMGLTIGPMFIALLTLQYSTDLTISILMCLPLLAAVIILTLPKPAHNKEGGCVDMFTMQQVFITLWQTPALKTTLLMTSGAAFSFAALPVLAVFLSETFGQGQEKGALLVTLYGVGCLCGATALIFKPMLKEALLLLRNIGILLVVCLILVVISSYLSFVACMLAYWICGVINSLFFAATIAARTEYAPEAGAAQIYMWVAAAKITAASAGAFAAGVLVEQLISLPMFLSIALLSSTILLCFWRVKFKKRL